jgi:hypothetical protein
VDRSVPAGPAAGGEVGLRGRATSEAIVRALRPPAPKAFTFGPVSAGKGFKRVAGPQNLEPRRERPASNPYRTVVYGMRVGRRNELESG